MATNFSPSKGSHVLNQFPSTVMFSMKGFYISAGGAVQGHHGPIQGHHGPLVLWVSGVWKYGFFSLVLGQVGPYFLIVQS